MKSSGRRIFVVDDDEEDRDLLFTAFKHQGVADDVQLVETASALFSALDNLEGEELPKLIILDHQTPGELGSETLAQLKSSLKYRHIPVAIYSSAMTSSIKEELQKKKHAALVLEKPAVLAQYAEHIALFDELAK